MTQAIMDLGVRLTIICVGYSTQLTTAADWYVSHEWAVGCIFYGASNGVPRTTRLVTACVALGSWLLITLQESWMLGYMMNDVMEHKI